MLIVDDSVVARTVMTRMVETGGFTLAGAVPDVHRALALLANETVDVILLDLEMPGVDGLSALPELLSASGGAKVLIVSSNCGDGAAATLRALALGAADTLVKPGAGGLSGRFADTLVERITRLTERTAAGQARIVVSTPQPNAFDLVAIGASTGGIHALGQLFAAVPRDFQQPIVVTQHLPASFTPYFAAQVALLAGRPCDVAADSVRLRPGRVVIAPGDAHLTAVALTDGGAATRLSRDPVVNGNVPSVDPMFATLANVFGPRLLAIVLSGMGRDGLEGARRVRDAGGMVVVQDPASSVVWGMPGAVVDAGLADAVLTPAEIGALIAGGRRGA
ncbi:response regulator [Sphingomonas sp. SUN019]|uniref:chemotaxis protein CheB n=1 Tax=Sphingomonas sp. SUN019 TaxID=2937788 RepID=UPI002164DC9E|nr:chemotaxis protein CheB [Sphingomonas sp. SUN019]UVO52215.1 response regulator [Sphingomonas sp. SUN019]